MRTLIIIAIGLAWVGILLAIARWSRRPASLSTFIPLWFVAAVVNMWIGISQAGYTFIEELPIFLLIFGVPAIAALLLRRLARQPSEKLP